MSLDKVWITRWALSEGIVEWEPANPDDLTVAEDGTLVVKRWYSYEPEGHGPVTDEDEPAHIKPSEWARSLEEAHEKVADLAEKKWRSLARRMNRLAAIHARTKQAKVKPAKRSNNFRAWNLE